jgi:hypothetical protein
LFGICDFGEVSNVCEGNFITVNVDIGKCVIVNLDCTAVGAPAMPIKKP